jgi:hypothetical protein
LPLTWETPEQNRRHCSDTELIAGLAILAVNMLQQRSLTGWSRYPIVESLSDRMGADTFKRPARVLLLLRPPTGCACILFELRPGPFIVEAVDPIGTTRLPHIPS